MNERPIDRHESRRTFAVSRVNKWQDAWTACYEVVRDQQTCDLKSFHLVFERWVPILNWIFEKPIFRLELYEPLFYYCSQQNGPKEVIMLYLEPSNEAATCKMHIIFNLFEFNNIYKRFCSDMSQSNQLLLNEARGTINLSSLFEEEQNTAEYFQTMTCWQLLFVHTLHALAHLDIYDKTRHAHYDKHHFMRDSVFFRFYCNGEVVYRK